MAQDYYPLPVKDALKALGTSEKGLSSEEAKKRLGQYGPNKLRERKAVSPLVLFISQFKNLLVIILVIATVISALIGAVTDAIVILVIVILNAVFGFIQEYKAEKAIEALKKMIVHQAIVIRDGHEQKIPAEELVPGDVIVLEAGDSVPADARLMESLSIKTAEAPLTGESMPVTKNTAALKGAVPVVERVNCVFMGTTVVYGDGKAVVTSTGMDTEIGRIAELIQLPEKATPLQKKMSHLAKWLTAAIILISATITIIGIARGFEAVEMFLVGVSLAVAAIPEGLPAVVTITLALGLQKLAKRNAVIRRLPAAETLGSVTVICSDKTGTFTKNQMTVTRIYADREVIEVTGEGYSTAGEFIAGGKTMQPLMSETLKKLLLGSLLCNNAEVTDEKVIGDPTEGALVVAAEKAGLPQELRNKHPLLDEIPFDSKKKRMSTFHEIGGQKISFVKGAPEVIINQCSHIMLKGKKLKLTKEYTNEALAVNKSMAGDALRVLAVAFKESDKVTDEDLVFLGLTGMIDPPRPEVKPALELCKQAGIKVVMITGDHALTAAAIAKQVGLIDHEGKNIITGAELDAMSDEGLQELVEGTAVFARVSPEHKVRIVKALKKNGHLTAVTGDGVNDAPAIKEAGIGISMGITGTDVAKEASDMVLSDDNFATIVTAIQTGRNIFDNIKKFIKYLLSCNAGEVMVMFSSIMAGFPVPLVPIQILWMNLVTDGVPALALGIDPEEDDVMKRLPRDPRKGTISRKMALKILLIGLMACIATLLVFTHQLGIASVEKAQTMAFTTLMMVQMAIVFTCRTPGVVIGRKLLHNKLLLLAVASSVALQLAVIYIPSLQPLFHTVPLGMNEWIEVLAAAFGVFFAIEIGKVAFKGRLSALYKSPRVLHS